MSIAGQPNDSSHRQPKADAVDRSILAAFLHDPWATQVAIGQAAKVSRNTVRARIQRYREMRGMRSFDRTIDPAFLGYHLRAYIFTTVRQSELDSVAAALAAIPEVLEINGLSGEADLLIEVVAQGADDLYSVAGSILDTPGVERTSTGLVMRPLVPYRIHQLLN